MLDIIINIYLCIFFKLYVGYSFIFQEEELFIENLDVDYEFFNEKIWLRLVYRILVFENIKVSAKWGFCVYICIQFI